MAVRAKSSVSGPCPDDRSGALSGFSSSARAKSLISASLPCGTAFVEEAVRPGPGPGPGPGPFVGDAREGPRASWSSGVTR